MSAIKKTIANILCGVLCVSAVAGAGAALYLGGKNNGWFDEYIKHDMEHSTPDNSGKNAIPETVTLSVTVPRSTAKATALTADNDSGVSAQSSYTINSTADFFICYTENSELNAKVINNVFPWDYSGTAGLFYACKKDSSGNTGLLISKDRAQTFFSSIDSNEYTLSGISMRVVGSSSDIFTFTEIAGDVYYLHVPISATFEKCICLNFTANTPPRDPVPLPDDPVKEGYNFVGWYYDRDLTIPYDGEPIYADTELFAKFEIARYTVIFNSNGGSSVRSKTVEWNNSVALSTPTKTGYTFKGWYLSDGTQYTNQAIKEDITLTAHWDITMCTVTFYVNGEIYETKTVEYGTPFSVIVETANVMSLQVMSLSADNELSMTDCIVVDDSLKVTATFMDGVNKVVNTAKNNKWAVIGGVAGGVAFIAVIAAACSGAKRKKRK